MNLPALIAAGFINMYHYWVIINRDPAGLARSAAEKFGQITSELYGEALKFARSAREAGRVLNAANRQSALNWNRIPSVSGTYPSGPDRDNCFQYRVDIRWEPPGGGSEQIHTTFVTSQASLNPQAVYAMAVEQFGSDPGSPDRQDGSQSNARVINGGDIQYAWNNC